MLRREHILSNSGLGYCLTCGVLSSVVNYFEHKPAFLSRKFTGVPIAVVPAEPTNSTLLPFFPILVSKDFTPSNSILFLFFITKYPYLRAWFL